MLKEITAKAPPVRTAEAFKIFESIKEDVLGKGKLIEKKDFSVNPTVILRTKDRKLNGFLLERSKESKKLAPRLRIFFAPKEELMEKTEAHGYIEHLGFQFLFIKFNYFLIMVIGVSGEFNSDAIKKLFRQEGTSKFKATLIHELVHYMQFNNFLMISPRYEEYHKDPMEQEAWLAQALFTYTHSNNPKKIEKELSSFESFRKSFLEVILHDSYEIWIGLSKKDREEYLMTAYLHAKKNQDKLQIKPFNKIHAYHKHEAFIIIPVGLIIWILGLFFGALISIVSKAVKKQNKPDIVKSWQYIITKHTDDFESLWHAFRKKALLAKNKKEYELIYKTMEKDLTNFFDKHLKNTEFEKKVTGKELSQIVIQSVVSYAEVKEHQDKFK